MEFHLLVSCVLLWCAVVGHNGLAAMTDEVLMSSSANYAYADAIGKAILFFEGQRSGKLPTTQRVTWRGDSALSDGNLQNVNLVGGYYDAGDNLFDFADKYRGSYSASCPFYCSYSGYQDELLWAASWLYKASGENKYLSYIISNQVANLQLQKIKKDQVDYILGNNPMKMSYMVGFGSKYPKQLHHRGSSIPSIKVHPAKVGCNDGHSNYFSSPNPNPNTHVGAIVGGPDSNDQFNDARSDYSHAEPTTYINAAFVGSVAALLGQTESTTLQFPQIGDGKANEAD
ncbi:Six-hairpin glycosidase superfamily [Sesbania bispinosa]|nr:Six-hairpin glycosidase superfamily [Sesbania bispinosa]